MPQGFGELPRSLEAHTRRERLGAEAIPALLVHPDRSSGRTVPAVLWMHGRTASKETDPGRYLRLLRAGLGVCAVDLPGHGERLDEDLQRPERGLDVVVRMMDEIDAIVAALDKAGAFDTAKLGIGGISAGGMAVLARLCRPHTFTCASVEATSGSWRHQKGRAMFRGDRSGAGPALDPIRNLEGWREIPFQAFHSRRDAWMSYAGQAAFVDALRERATDPGLIDFVAFEETGAPHEHIGFGRRAAEVKDRHTAFFARWLLQESAKVATGTRFMDQQMTG